MSSRRRALSAFVVLAVAALSSSTLAAQTRNWDGIAALCKGRNLRACVDEQVMLTDLPSFLAAALDARNMQSSMGRADNVNGRWMLTGWEFAQVLHQDVGGSAPTTFNDSPHTTLDDSPRTTFGGSPSLGYKSAGGDVLLGFIAPTHDLTNGTDISSASAPSGASLELMATETTTSPEPGTILLLGSGLVGLGGLGAMRRRRNRN